MTCFTEISSSPDDVTVISKSTVIPSQNSTIGDLQLSVSDLPMLSCHYIQKGCLFTRPPFATSAELVTFLKDGLSETLTHFPALAGRLNTDADGYVYITCNDAGADFIHAAAKRVYVRDVLSGKDVPDVVKQFFTYDRTVSYKGHFQPILAVQVTELADGLFIGCSVNHSITDGTSLWNFINTFAEVCRGVKKITKPPAFSRDSVLISPAVLRIPDGGPVVTFNENEPLRERIFSFSRESILQLKSKVNNKKFGDDPISAVELLGKQSNDPWKEAKSASIFDTNWFRNAITVSKPQIVNETESTDAEVSSFQSLCALLWRSVTRARKLNVSKTTTFRMAINCRHRLEPKLDPLYFGNAIQSIPTYATVGDVLSKDLRWAAVQLNKNVKAHGDETVRKSVADWESNPRTFPLGNFDGGMITMGSSPRFPMYDNDFGWGHPVAVRSGRANKFDGKISAFPGREGGGNVDLEVVLSPETMAGLESDPEFMQFVTGC